MNHFILLETFRRQMDNRIPWKSLKCSMRVLSYCQFNLEGSWEALPWSTWSWAASPNSEGVQLQTETTPTSTVAPSPQQLLFLRSAIAYDSVSAF